MPSSHLAGAWLAHKNRYKDETPAERKARIKETLRRSAMRKRSLSDAERDESYRVMRDRKRKQLMAQSAERKMNRSR